MQCACRNFVNEMMAIRQQIEMSHMKKLQKEKRYQEVGMLNTAMVAACWTAERRHRAGMGQEPICPRCEEQIETMQHRLWECRCNNDSEDPRMPSRTFERPLNLLAYPWPVSSRALFAPLPVAP